jgi:hypothetical protein
MVDGDLEIICCAVDEGGRFHLAGINSGSTNRSTRDVTYIVQNMCIRAMTLRYRSEGWGLNSQASWIRIPTPAPQT